MTQTKPAEKQLDGCVVAIFVACIAIFVVPLALFYMLTWSSGYWSVAVRNVDVTEPCSLTFTFDGRSEPTKRVDGVISSPDRNYLMKERGDGTLRSVTVVLGDRERTTVLDQRLSGGTNVDLTIRRDLGVESSVDYDHHM